QGGRLYPLFNLPHNVHTLKLQFLPINQIHSHFKTIQHLHHPYTYYSFIHTIPLNSPSHLYLKSTQLNKNVNNAKQFQLN
uniref:SasC/FmtB family protein n=1 Tax=Staphylococcus epidermidis TaxID=1282 RepID=UPI0011A7EB55